MGLDTDKWFVLSLVFFFFFLARPQLLYRHRGPHQKASRFCLVGQRPWEWDKDKRTFESWMTQLLKKKHLVLFMFRELSKRIWIINASFIILIISSLKIKSARISNFQCAWWWNWCVSFFLTDYFYYVANKAILQLLNFRAISHFTRYLFKAGLRNRRYENSTR